MKRRARRRICSRLALTNLNATSECRSLPFKEGALERLACRGGSLSVALLDRVSDDGGVIQLFLLDRGLELFYARGRSSVLARESVVAMQHA